MKRLLSFVFSLSIALSAFVSPLPIANAQSYSVKKIVSLVYDDSGSMKGQKWAYANYAMQTFCGMLNSNDELYITYMSRPSDAPKKIDLSNAGMQRSIDTIRNHYQSDGTPFAAVERAYNKLRSVSGTDANTQYWLVVITDGEFAELSSLNDLAKKNYLNSNFKKYSDTQMANGTHPQITFLSIGTGVTMPDHNETRGIYTYNAASSDGIMNAMSSMAHRVSGRTRVAGIKQITPTSLELTSALPLMNMAVVSQKTSAKITKVTRNKSEDLHISRNISLSYPNYSDLSGKTYLIDNSTNIIEAGTYTVEFDSNINADSFVFLFEPAIEPRLTITANGEQVNDVSQLNSLCEKDKISVSCKLYKTGKDEEINPSLLPAGTNCSLTLYEDEKAVKSVDGSKMEISDYPLSNKNTKIKVSVNIKDFNPITASCEFKPNAYGYGDSFSVTSDYISSSRSVKYSEIASNKTTGIRFTLYKDGNPITDPELVKAAKPKITVSPAGNDGNIIFEDDGGIVFIPQKAHIAGDVEGFDAEVTCTIGENTSATATYSVLVANYEAVSCGNDVSIVKTQFFNNKKGASFYINKNGEKLSKASLPDKATALLNEEYSHLKTEFHISDDGTITVIPYSEEEHKLTFWNWWSNWWYYFNLPGKDIEVTFIGNMCQATSMIDVCGESFVYQLLNVYLPLIIEITLLALLIIWLYLIITKPRYSDSAKLYVGTIHYNKSNYTHNIRNFHCVKLSKFNKIKKGNGRLKFKREADIVSAGGVKIRADYDSRIICSMPFPWYRGTVTPLDYSLAHLKTPQLINEYFSNHTKLEIEEFSTTETVNNVLDRTICPNGSVIPKYTVIPEAGTGVMQVDGRNVIRTGTIFIYTN